MTKTIIQKSIKFCIIAFTIIATGGMLFIFISSFSRNTMAGIFDYILLIIAFVSGVMSISFHIKTYPYYSKIKRKQSIHKLFWVAALIVPAYVSYIIKETLVNYFYGTNASITQDIGGFIFIIIFVFFSLVSIIEVFFMFKRIQKRHENLSLEQELDNIGNNSVL